MKTSTFNHITQITALPRLFPMNAFLVEETAAFTLVDALPKRYSQKLIRIITRICTAKNKPLNTVLITHAHSDHIGDIKKIKQAFPYVQVGIGAIEYAHLRDENKRGNLMPLSQIPDFLLQEGDAVGSLYTLASPGHTPGSLSFYHQEDKQLITGDLIQTKGRNAIAGDFVWTFPFMFFGTWDHALAEKSVQKLSAYPVTRIFCGHGNSVCSWETFLAGEKP